VFWFSNPVKQCADIAQCTRYSDGENEMLNYLVGSMIIAVGAILANPSNGVDLPPCCTRGADCCVVADDCCPTSALTNTVANDSVGSVAQPICCDKRAYCCTVRGACCNKHQVRGSGETNGNHVLANDSAESICCLKRAYCCSVKQSCCAR
jgi:hypothetical protein